MESLAYLHLALAYETSYPSESGRELQQMGGKGLGAEISKESPNISSLPGTQLIPKCVPSLNLIFLIRLKSIILVLFLLLSSPVGADICRCGYICEFHTSNELVINRKNRLYTRKNLKKNPYKKRGYINLNKTRVLRSSILRLHSEGEQVFELKDRLFALDYLSNVHVSKKFDLETKQAVEEFQEANNLKRDGIVGSKTQEALLKEFEALFPSSMSARGLLNRGLREVTFKSSLINYNQAIERDGKFAEAYYSRGMLYAYASTPKENSEGFTLYQNIDQALKDFTEAIKFNPEYAAAYLERGIFNAKNKKLKESIKDWDQVILIEPDNTEAYYRRAKAKEQLGGQERKESAINDYIAVIELQLRAEQDTYLKAQIEELINNFYSKKLSAEIIGLDLFRGIASANLSEIIRERVSGNINRAAEDRKSFYESAIAIEKQKYRAYPNIQLLANYYTALNEYNLYINNNSNDEDKIDEDKIQRLLKDFSNIPFPSAYYYRGILLLASENAALKHSTKHFDEAIKEFDEAIQKEPNFTKAYYIRGVIRSQELGKKQINGQQNQEMQEQKIINDFNKYLDGDSEMEEAKKMRDYPKSSDLVLKALQVCPTQKIPQQYLNTLKPSSTLDATAYVRRGKLRFWIGDYPGARKDFDRAIKLNRNLADAYYQKARVAAYEYEFLNSEEKAKEAMRDFDEAIKKNTNFADAYFERGYLRYKIATSKEDKNQDSNLIKAIKYDFTRSVQSDKDFAEAYYLLAILERYGLNSNKNIPTEFSGGKEDEYLNRNTKSKLSETEIGNLTKAIRSDVYFYSKIFLSNFRTTLQRNICFNLETFKLNNIENTIGAINIIPFKSQTEFSYYTMALDNYRKSQYAKAIVNINKALKINPDISDYYTIRGASFYFLNYENVENYNQALQDLQKSIQLDPPRFGGLVTYSTSVSHFLIGNILRKNSFKMLKKEDKKDSQEYYEFANFNLPKPDWLVVRGIGGNEAVAGKSTTQGVSSPGKRCK